jgi:uncharacterized Zn-finger protein
LIDLSDDDDEVVVLKATHKTPARTSHSAWSEAAQNAQVEVCKCVSVAIPIAIVGTPHRPSGAKPFPCALCDKAFTQSANLKTHVRTVHEKEKRFRCSVCGEAFGQNSHLTDHLRTQSGAKPFACRFCPFRCSTSSNLRQHERSLHPGQTD